MKNFGKCGILACLVMLITGTIFGCIGIVAAHSLIKHLSHYYLILIPTFVLALILGLGLNWGARIGRCSRFNIVTFFLVVLFSLVCYGAILFMNDYHDSFPEPPSLVQEGLFLASDSINFLAELPFISDYVKPIEVQTLQGVFANLPLISTLLPPEQHAEQEVSESPVPENDSEENAGVTPETEGITPSRVHLGTQVMTFLKTVPEQAFAQEPVVIGTIFDLVIFVPVQNYLLYPGVTFWKEDDGVKQLAFDERAVQPWMAWTVEFLFLWLITLVITRSGTKKAYRHSQKRLENRRGPSQQRLQLGVKKEPESEKKEKKGFFGRKKKEKREDENETKSTPIKNPIGEEGEEQEEEGLATKKKKKKVKVKKKKRGWFGRSKNEAEGEEVGGAVVLPETAEAGVSRGSQDGDLEFEFSEAEEKTQEQLFAIILYQYAQERQDDLIQLIQQVGQVSEARARSLLKVPSLIKRDVTTQQANIAIEKFNQVQAQVRLITMEQLLEHQNKQRQAATQQSASSQPPASGSTGERYALILRKFDTSQRKQVLELLSSLSGTPVADLQQSLKTPALVLRDASKDEVTMIAQQFKNIQADVKLLTMTELQRLMAKK